MNTLACKIIELRKGFRVATLHFAVMQSCGLCRKYLLISNMLLHSRYMILEELVILHLEPLSSLLIKGRPSVMCSWQV
jgi:hypothetical protein